MKENIIFDMAFVNDETEMTYNWVFKELKRLLPKEPAVFITDEDRSIQNGISANYSESMNIVCLWHVVQNLIKHTSYLSIVDEDEIKILYTLCHIYRKIY